MLWGVLMKTLNGQNIDPEISPGPITNHVVVLPVDQHLISLLAPINYELLSRFDDDQTLWEMITEYIQARFVNRLMHNRNEHTKICGELLDVYVGSRDNLHIFQEVTEYIDQSVSGAMMSILDHTYKNGLVINMMYPVGVATMRNSLFIIVECGFSNEVLF